MITVCILSYQNNLLISGDDVDQKLSIEYTRAEKIVRHLTKELQILEKEIKSKQIDYQPFYLFFFNTGLLAKYRIRHEIVRP